MKRRVLLNGETHGFSVFPPALERTSRGRAREGYRSWSQSKLPSLLSLATPTPPLCLLQVIQTAQETSRQGPSEETHGVWLLHNHVTSPCWSHHGLCSTYPTYTPRGLLGLNPFPVVSSEHCMGMEYNVCKWAPEQAGQGLGSLSTKAFWVLLIRIFGFNRDKKKGKRMVNFSPFFLASNFTIWPCQFLKA